MKGLRYYYYKYMKTPTPSQWLVHISIHENLWTTDKEIIYRRWNDNRT